MKRHNSSQSNTHGFTIIEQLVASTVLSIILLVINAGFMHILRLYYKTVNQVRIQETVRSVADGMGDAIRYNNNNMTLTSFPAPLTPDIAATNPNDTGFMCIGSTRYTFAIDRQLVTEAPNTANKQKKHVLWIDQPPTCVASADLTADTPTADGHELMRENMRLTRFEITSINVDTFRINLGIAFGEDDLLKVDGSTKACKPNVETSGTAFCAVSNLSVVVNTRLL